GGRGTAPRIAETRYLRDAVAGTGFRAMAETGGRRSAVRRRAGVAGKSRPARLVRECGVGHATACPARTARRALFPESPHVEGPADRFGGALPHRQRRTAGAG